MQPFLRAFNLAAALHGAIKIGPLLICQKARVLEDYNHDEH